MIQYSDLVYLVNQFNLTGDLAGTSTVPGINLTTDSNDNYIISYTYFANENELTAASYYDIGGLEAQKIVDAADYKIEIETALDDILKPTGNWNVSFSDVAGINFQESTIGTGIITFAQMEGSFFSSENTSAFSVPYDGSNPHSTENSGDIWINTDHDTTNGDGLFFDYNIWEESGAIEAGTRAYKVLMRGGPTWLDRLTAKLSYNSLVHVMPPVLFFVPRGEGRSPRQEEQNHVHNKPHPEFVH